MARIDMFVPDPDPGDLPKPGETVTTMFIEPEGKVPGRETPGFFVMKIDGTWVYPDAGSEMPKQFLSLDAVHAYLFERYGTAPPLHVTAYMRIARDTPKDFPVLWGGTRRLEKSSRVSIQVRYIGSFRYWDGRLVDPTKVGTPQEFN